MSIMTAYTTKAGRRAKMIFLICGGIEALAILIIVVANCFQGVGYAFFYNFLYGLCLSVALPLALACYRKEGLASFGIFKPGRRQVLVIAAFVLFSVGGQLIPPILNDQTIQWWLLPMAVLPLVMTSFFEEFLFRGFMQTRIERRFGTLAAIALSGLFFSLYHLGYPGFRTFEDIALLFAVGIGFALAFKLGGNSLFVSYWVNLPNAFVTYVLKFDQFPTLTPESSIYAILTLVGCCLVLACFQRASRNRRLATENDRQ